MKDLEEKYQLAVRLLEIDIELKKKYRIQTEAITSLVGGLGELEPKTYPIPEEIQFFFDPSEKILERIKSRYERKVFDKDDYGMALNCAIYTHENSIGGYTEEFWLKVQQEGLPIKRKNNWLLKILKIGYLSLDIHKSVFYLGIQELLDSDVFNLVYNENIRKQILDLIEISNQRLINKLEKLVKKKQLNSAEICKTGEYEFDLYHYGSFFNIPDDLLKEFKILCRKY